jgi:hypothetical protein
LLLLALVVLVVLVVPVALYRQARGIEQTLAGLQAPPTADAIAAAMLRVLNRTIPGEDGGGFGGGGGGSDAERLRPLARQKQLLLLRQWQDEMGAPLALIKGRATVSGVAFDYIMSDTVRQWNAGLVVGVLSTATNADARDFIRKTWGRNRKVLFVVSAVDARGSGLLHEMRLHKDLLVLKTKEDYQKLTYKKNVLFVAADAHIGKFRYLLKTDDDCHIFADRVLAALDAAAPVDYWGRCNLDGAPVVRDPDRHWYVSYEEFPEARFPPYCSGGGYALSRRFVKCAAKQVPAQKFLSMEDVSTGVLAEKCGVKPIHDEHVTPLPDPIVYQLPRTHVLLPKAKVKGLLGLD